VIKVKIIRDNYLTKCVDENDQIMDEIERHALKTFVIASRSFKEYVGQVNPPVKRQIIAWSSPISLWFTFVCTIIMIRSNDPQVWISFGWPFMFLPDSLIHIITLSLTYFVSAFLQVSLSGSHSNSTDGSYRSNFLLFLS
jgi:hypothetical protein